MIDLEIAEDFNTRLQNVEALFPSNTIHIDQSAPYWCPIPFSNQFSADCDAIKDHRAPIA